jgi:hypothetical protein
MPDTNPPSRISQDSFLEALDAIDSGKRALAPSLVEIETADSEDLIGTFKLLRDKVELYRKKYLPPYTA